MVNDTRTDRRWRFPDNHGTKENGLSTSEIETFLKDPVASLAREICQNSIDASYGPKPVRVEFRLFEIDEAELPDIEGLRSEIDECWLYKGDSQKEGRQLASLKACVDRRTIRCLRISDFNTTGLEGAFSSDRNTSFYNLTRGSGVSDKGGASGGSKGIGKFASFVVSATNTVFYSTRAIDGSRAHIGISKLRSRPLDDPRLMTEGTGYYAEGDYSAPIEGELALDKAFRRDEGQCGTDIYIIGFNDDGSWKENIMIKVLESFMVAIWRGDLEVTVGDVRVDRDTIEDLIYDERFRKSVSKGDIKDVTAQYEMLEKKGDVVTRDIDVGGSAVTVYMKRYKAGDAERATNRCYMIRSPYMKIKYMRPGGYIPFSAICVIHDNALNRRLRAIENPQHTDWELKRLNDDPEGKKLTKTALDDMKDRVNEFIREELHSSSSETTDLEGAGKFLPAPEELGSVLGETTEQAEKMAVTPISRSSAKKANTRLEGEDAFGLAQGDEFAPEGDDGDGLPDGGPSDAAQGADRAKGRLEGGEASIGRTALRDIRCRSIVVDRDLGMYDCVFTPQSDEPECELVVKLRGDGPDRYAVAITEASIDGRALSVEGGRIVGLKLKKGRLCKISYSVDRAGLFASEVIVYARRK